MGDSLWEVEHNKKDNRPTKSGPGSSHDHGRLGVAFTSPSSPNSHEQPPMAQFPIGNLKPMGHVAIS